MNKKKIFIFLIMIFMIISSSSLVFADTEKDVYVIPIKGDIDNSTYQFVEREIKIATENDARAIIFEIDTFGGLIDQAEKIKSLIVKAGIPTISYVNTKAESAGVLLTISSDTIVMSNGSTIGSAEPIPNTEKTLSYWVEELRSTAETKDRDPELVASMADNSISIDGIIDEGRLLNLNFKRAKELGFADFIANSHSEILDELNIEYDEIIVTEVDFITKLAKFVVNPYVLSLLLTIGFIGIVVEIFTPGFGVGATISILSFTLYFGSNFIVGNSGWTALLLFIAGIILLIIEAIVPGFGIPGIGGIASIVVAIVLASPDVQIAIFSIILAFVLSILVAYLFLKYGQKSPYFDKIVLNEKGEGSSGYSSTIDNIMYLNKEGEALTTLRPSGTIIVDDIRLDAVTEGQFIKKGERIKIVKIEGSRIVVRKILF